ncbi:MAG: rod shape-determining protein MreC [Bacteroidota bacterium]|uniref:rod shape-determining protein MreC n=1 Tax=Parabacteroides sp. FAFU027 TaxID=2922715 RepID=UPI001FAF86F7|nr:rod shape-determining protein MreC [Parabacteroides sp. FAFU027]MDP4270440.1 rod shape-determining protein MreC [Bacteroidota bacterium]
MRNLIQFLVKHSNWIVLLIYTILGFVLLFNFNIYHRSVYLGSGNKLAGDVYAVSSSVTGYFNLKQTNGELLEQNSRLEMEVLQLKDQLKIINAGKLSNDSVHNRLFQRFGFITAQVINNSVNHTQNYITLNRGELDGIKTEMGVVDQNGVIGKVVDVSDHYAVVISLLNPKLKLSAKIQRTQYFGSVNWDGANPEYAQLLELPSHVEYKKGDTLVTSGFSGTFPEGIMIGTIETNKPKNSGEMRPIRIKLSTRFSRLSNVRVITNKLINEQQELENKVQQL